MGGWSGGKAFTVFVSQFRGSFSLLYNLVTTHLHKLSKSSAIQPQSILGFLSMRTAHQLRQFRCLCGLGRLFC
jgi:hypothetical protein